jgi:hypothetical protein
MHSVIENQSDNYWERIARSWNQLYEENRARNNGETRYEIGNST